MSIFNGINYVEDLKRDELLVKKGLLVGLFLDYDDKRFMNIPAPVVDGMENTYRDSCEIQVEYDYEKQEYYISNKIYIVTAGLEDYIFGELTKEEVEEIRLNLMQLGEEYLNEQPVTETLTDEKSFYAGFQLLKR